MQFGLSALCTDLSLRRVDFLHGEPDTTLAIDFQDLDLHDIAFGQFVTDFLDSFVRDLRNMHQAILARQDRDERAKIHQAGDLALVNATHFDVCGNQLDATLGFLAG